LREDKPTSGAYALIIVVRRGCRVAGDALPIHEFSIKKGQGGDTGIFGC
jgi:hypothetical protein